MLETGELKPVKCYIRDTAFALHFTRETLKLFGEVTVFLLMACDGRVSYFMKNGPWQYVQRKYFS